MMEWSLKELTEIEPKKFEKEIENIDYGVLNERLYNFQKLHKELSDDSSLLVEEKLQKRARLRTIESILRQTTAQKQREHSTQEGKLAEKWKTETLKTTLPNIRYAHGIAIEHLLNGSYTLDVIPWETPTSMELTIDNRKINLEKLISPQILKNMIDKPFAPAYFTLQPSGMFRKGKLQGIWYDGENYDRSKNDEYRSRILLAVMKV